MFCKQGLSKSVKRRRLLDANNFIEYLYIDNTISPLVSYELNNYKNEVNTVLFVRIIYCNVL